MTGDETTITATITGTIIGTTVGTSIGATVNMTVTSATTDTWSAKAGPGKRARRGCCELPLYRLTAGVADQPDIRLKLV